LKYVSEVFQDFNHRFILRQLGKESMKCPIRILKKDNKAFRSKAAPCGAMKSMISARIYCVLAEQALP
jgi:hypothetical protein